MTPLHFPSAPREYFCSPRGYVFVIWYLYGGKFGGWFGILDGWEKCHKCLKSWFLKWQRKRLNIHYVSFTWLWLCVLSVEMESYWERDSSSEIANILRVQRKKHPGMLYAVALLRKWLLTTGFTLYLFSSPKIHNLPLILSPQKPPPTQRHSSHKTPLSLLHGVNKFIWNSCWLMSQEFSPTDGKWN